MSTEIYSHPGILLETRLSRVHSLGMQVFNLHDLYPDLKEVLEVMLLFHDLGKSSSYFQAYLQDEDHTSSNYTKHGEISAIIAYQYLIGKGVTPAYAMLAYLTIKKHHGDLDNIQNTGPELSDDVLLEIAASMDYGYLNAFLAPLFPDLGLSCEVVTNYIRQFASRLYQVKARKFTQGASDRLWTAFRYLFSILVWSDKNEAIFKENAAGAGPRIWRSEFVGSYRATLPPSNYLMQRIREDSYRQIAESDVSADILALNLPTGAGKTIAALKAALNLVKGRQGRIIYCLPFTSIIDQNHQVFHSILKTNGAPDLNSVLLAHHHLTEYVYSKGEDTYSDNEAEFLIESWDSEVIVTTFYQLLHTLFKSHNRALIKYHRLANSVLILDEVQNIPARYWNLLNKHLILLARELKLKIILVTATMPLIFERASHEISDLVESETWFKKLNRINLITTGLSHSLNVDEFTSELLIDLKERPDLNRLVIVNTIQASLDLYGLLKENLGDSHLVYLSSNVVPAHRLDRIDSIRKRKIQGAVIVSTQVVEAGVDIDIDVVYRDIAPLDCIIQACGRCNRNNGTASANVHLIKLKDDNREYHKYVYDPTLIDATLSVLKGAEAIQESEFSEIVHKYYRELSNRITRDISDVLLSHISGCRFKSVDDNFSLYDDDPRKTVFVEMDDKAEVLLDRYSRALTGTYEDDFQKRAAIKSAFRSLAPYIINVPEKYMKTDDEFCIIDKTQWRSVYNLETGFIRKPASSVVVCP